MAKVLEGLTVIELAHYAFVPSAGAVLAEWGARVIKIEHPRHGDPMRGVTINNIPPGAGGLTFMWELSNRGKESIGLDLTDPRGLEILLDLARSCDVFLTSFLPAARQRLGVDFAAISAVNARVVYAVGSGQGLAGPEGATGGYDQTSFWFRSGISTLLHGDDDGFPPELPTAGLGDVMSGMALAGAISAALFNRERTNEAQTVDVSLLGAGLWAAQSGISAASVLGGRPPRRIGRYEVRNPLVNTYRTSDSRFVALCMIQADRYWADLCSAFDEPGLADDARFANQDLRADNSEECVRAIDKWFESRTLEETIVVLSTLDGQWSIIQEAGELRADSQAQANHYVQQVEYGPDRGIDLVSSPARFNGADPVLQPAPELGAHTELVLLEGGLAWDDIAELKSRGVVT